MVIDTYDQFFDVIVTQHFQISLENNVNESS